MISPVSAISPDNPYTLPYVYGLGYGYLGRVAAKQPAPESPPIRTEIKDIISLSPAAQSILDQSVRMSEMNKNA